MSVVHFLWLSCMSPFNFNFNLDFQWRKFYLETCYIMSFFLLSFWILYIIYVNNFHYWKKKIYKVLFYNKIYLVSKKLKFVTWYIQQLSRGIFEKFGYCPVCRMMPSLCCIVAQYKSNLIYFYFAFFLPCIFHKQKSFV